MVEIDPVLDGEIAAAQPGAVMLDIGNWLAGKPSSRTAATSAQAKDAAVEASATG